MLLKLPLLKLNVTARFGNVAFVEATFDEAKFANVYFAEAK